MVRRKCVVGFLNEHGLQGGGTNFDAKIRRNSTDLEDIFIAHISGRQELCESLINQYI